MHNPHAHADPPRTFADRLRSLNDNLQALASRLKDAIATAVSTALGQAIRDAIRRLLGDVIRTSDPYERQGPSCYGRQHRDPYGSYGRENRDPYDGRSWDEDYDPWHEDSYEAADSLPSEPGNRWTEALRASIQTALLWLRTQPCRKPLLTTTLVALAAGGVALFAGPTLAACVSVVASVASLLLTADSARTAGELATAI
jgi:hypothetical protein